MSLFTKLFPKQSVNIATDDFLQMITGYQPVFTSFDGGVYEASLCRSSIHAFASQVSKLDLKSVGPSDSANRILKKPNEWQTPSQFLYQLATILECQNTAFIFPRLDVTGKQIVALYAISPTEARVWQDTSGNFWLRCQFGYGETGMVELSRVGVLTKHQYKNPIFGEKNRPIMPTLDLINAQNQGIVEGVHQSATIRFLAKLAQTLKPEDIRKERERFVKENLSSSNNGGVMLYDAKYSDVKQINSQPFVADGKQMELINESVYTYFGTNKNIVMNCFTEDEWNAYYEGKVEPFAIMLSEVLSLMLFSNRELGFGNMVIASSNRLQYASNGTKLEVVTQLFDRGMMTQNMGFEIFNMPTIGEEGDKFYIRLEYTEVNKLNENQGLEDNNAN